MQVSVHRFTAHPPKSSGVTTTARSLPDFSKLPSKRAHVTLSKKAVKTAKVLTQLKDERETLRVSCILYLHRIYSGDERTKRRKTLHMTACDFEANTRFVFCLFLRSVLDPLPRNTIDILFTLLLVHRYRCVAQVSAMPRSILPVNVSHIYSQHLKGLKASEDSAWQSGEVVQVQPPFGC